MTSVRSRPALFRALGHAEPPPEIEVGNRVFRLVEVFKHDSWAATALYGDASGKHITCKFNRQQSVLGLPMRWLGRILARREAAFLRRLAPLPQVPNEAGPVLVAGRQLPHAVARDFVAGQPFRKRSQVTPAFFTSLERLMADVHAAGMAYVDLHKRENIIVDEAGKPHLIDFQVSFGLTDRWPGNGRLARAILRNLQEMDTYHLRKHVTRCFPDLMTAKEKAHGLHRPGLIGAHRRVAVPLRNLRRRFLTAIGVRDATGAAGSEHEPEAAFRGPGAVGTKDQGALPPEPPPRV